jgi:uncharacterized SAM-binding protein YcdF (DUF218 family)
VPEAAFARAPPDRRERCAAVALSLRIGAMEGASLKGLVSSLLLPPAGPLLLALLGAWLARGGSRGRMRAGRSLLVVGLLSAWLLSTSAVAEAMIGMLEAFSPPALTGDALAERMRGQAPPGAIVVLGSGVRHNEREWPRHEYPNARTLERLAFGALLAHESGLPVLVSGGTPRGRDASEAAMMAWTLRRSFAVEPRWIEEQSRDTVENAVESARLLRADGIRRVVLVTQAYHMPRAQAAFVAAGLEVLAAPHGFAGHFGVDGLGSFVPSAGAVTVSWLATHEAVGFLWYRLRGHL